MADFMNLANTINECFHAYGIHSATLQPELVQITPEGTSGSYADGIQDSEAIRKRADAACSVGCSTALCEDLTCCA